MLGTVSQADLAATCGPPSDQHWLCAQTYRITGSQTAANVADALATPLRIALILLAALVATRLLRRAVRGVVERIRDRGSLSAFASAPLLTPSESTRLRRAQRAATVSSVLRNIVSIVVWTAAVLIVLGELGINLAPLIAGAGIAGIAIGFGTQSIVRDYLSGLFVVLEDQYGVGDQVQTTVSNNIAVSGTVEWVSLRMTRVRDGDVTWYVPNGEIRAIGNLSQGTPAIGEPEAHRDEGTAGPVLGSADPRTESSAEGTDGPGR